MGYLKDNVYGRNPATLDELKEEIQQQYLTIPNTMIHDICESSVSRYQICLEHDDHQFQHGGPYRH
jgi:hypothetical protein